MQIQTPTLSISDVKVWAHPLAFVKMVALFRCPQTIIICE